MIKKLEDIVKVSGRVGWKGYTVDDLRNEGPWVIGANDITSNHKLTLHNAKHISREKFEESPEIIIDKYDILVVKVGSTIGKVAIVNTDIGEACINPNTVLLKNCTENPIYLYYYLVSDYGQKFLNNNSSASAQSALNQTDLKKLPIFFPTIEKQKKIAKVLSDLDAKIELNNKINAELETMAKTIYDYWFVQFDFPDVHGKPYKSSGGKMVWNEELKREIPEGWGVKELGRELSIQRGISYTSSQIKGEGIPMINLNSFNLDGTYKAEGLKMYSGNYADKHIISPGDLLIAVTDVTRNADIIGKSIIVPNYLSEAVISMDIAKIIPGDNLFESFLMFLFNSKHYHNYIKWFASGTIVLHLNLDGMNWYKTEIPPFDLQQKFDTLYKSIADRISLTKTQNQHLSSLRDWLLPMLMNGQVTVGDIALRQAQDDELGMVAEDNIKYGN